MSIKVELTKPVVRIMIPAGSMHVQYASFSVEEAAELHKGLSAVLDIPIVGKKKTAFVCSEEGTIWEPFKQGISPRRVHAIKFEDGSVWDAYNGWHD